MTDIGTNISPEVRRAVKLLKLREETKNPFKLLAVEAKIKSTSDNVLAQARKVIEDELDALPSVSATLKSATLTTTERDEPTIKGHSMNFEMTVDLPKKTRRAKAEAGEGEYARDLYGVYFEWWEEIVNEYDFTEPAVDANDQNAVAARTQRIKDKKASGEGSWTKPWSDIYLSNPQSQTFFSWKGSVSAALKGNLQAGSHVTGVRDNPAVNLSEDSFKKRILRFRINAGDANGSVFKGDAIQVLVVEDGELVSSYYTDSTGTTLSEGNGAVEVMKYSSTVDPGVRGNDALAFVKALQGDKAGCQAFDNSELDQVVAEAKSRNLDTMVGDFHKELNQSNRMNAVPLIPSSDEYWQYPASDGGILVAQLSGGKVKRLYHTDNETRTIDARANGAPVQYTVRTFEQLPVDIYVDQT